MSTKVLIVEDEAIIAEDLRSFLNTSGFHVTAVVRTATEALQKVSETDPDVVVMDLQLSGLMQGLEAVERIETEHTPPPKFLFITGLYLPDAAMIRNGHCRVIRKPYFATDVITAIRQLVPNGDGA